MQSTESSAKGDPTPFSGGDSHRFRLKKCNSRNKLTCPSCGRKFRFVPYIDTEGKFIFPEFVGRCDREDNCGYHYTPKRFFADYPDAKAKLKDGSFFSAAPIQARHEESKPELPPSFISPDLMQLSMRAYCHNNLVTFLHTIMKGDAVERVIRRYNIGTAKKWGNATVFWQVDTKKRVHAGKIILYDAINGHRVKNDDKVDVAWVHKTLGMLQFNLDQCYFGEHLLADVTKPVALVESEKTAIIASEFFPDYIWIASGGKSGCFNRRMHVLAGRNVVLYPDLKATGDWQVKAEQMRRLGINVEVSTYLEKVATQKERDAGLDIADFIINGIQDNQSTISSQQREAENLLKRMVAKVPLLQVLIDKLQLELIP